MIPADAKTIRLADYQPTPYLVEHVFLHFDLHEDYSEVKAICEYYHNPASSEPAGTLILNGESLELTQIAINGEPLDKDCYQIEADRLTINQLPDKFQLETTVRIHPENNTALSGLYKSGANFCSQNEAQGFRRITYFYDRPDVMTRFTTCISADKEKYPLLLSNGNLIEQKDLDHGRHWVKWEDPSKKPCYLFALVAGQFECITDQFTTCGGKNVTLKVFVEPGFIDQADYAMEALKRSMRWDEQAYGREYDLAIFMIVAISDFNMGAMENKGLNIFNTKYIMAKPETATDQDFIAIEEVIGHEYFHNWSGNRITCRDWFQITLKEGLTVFRDQHFTMDMTSATSKRIDDVNVIRNVQFLQDAGPMAHPIRPEEYMEINNFYTVTVYNKGAEVIRMLETLLGKHLFRKGMDHYFEHYDESAVTTEDFLQAMADVSGRDWDIFKRWYRQAGTPTLHCKGTYSSEQKTWTLEVEQSCPSTPGQAAADKKPFHIPLAIGLVAENGTALVLELAEHPQSGHHHLVLEITEKKQTFVFTHIEQAPIPSLLRDFSAPVKLDYAYSPQDNAILAAHDENGFVRWDAMQRLMTTVLLTMTDKQQAGQALELDPILTQTMSTILNNQTSDLQLLSRLVTLPSENYILQQMEQADVETVYAVRAWLLEKLGQQLSSAWQEIYSQCYTKEAYIYNAQAVGRRAMAQTCLTYLAAAGEEVATIGYDHIATQYNNADNMTDQYGSLLAINHIDCDLRTSQLDSFYQQWQNQPLIVDKWLSLEATSKLPHTLQRVKELLGHSAYNANNPNKIRALVGAFSSNLLHFHAKDGSGYDFLTEQIIKVDTKNPQISARLCDPLTRWKAFDPERQQKIKTCLQRLIDNPQCSKDVYEIAQKSLAH